MAVRSGSSAEPALSRIFQGEFAAIGGLHERVWSREGITDLQKFLHVVDGGRIGLQCIDDVLEYVKPSCLLRHYTHHTC